MKVLYKSNGKTTTLLDWKKFQYIGSNSVDVTGGMKGKLEKLPKAKIYLNINHLDEGTYSLNIIANNKIIKTTEFEKEQ